MPWPERIDAELPVPRPGEPETLREEIIAELSDHFRCAMDRERRFDIDEAHRRVLDRFGDPVQVARQLWFDALKGKVMSQRITLITSCVMAAACLAAVALAWTAVQQSRDVNNAILENLSALAASQGDRAGSLEWMPVKVRVVKETESGPPVEGCKVTLNGNLYGETGERRSRYVEETTDTEGIADFGLVRVGQHGLNVIAPWGEFFYREHTVRPGSEELFQIACPPPPETVGVTMEIVNLIEDPEQANLWVICHFGLTTRPWKGETWARHNTGPVVVTDRGVLDLHGKLQSPPGTMPMAMGGGGLTLPLRYQVKLGEQIPQPTLQWPEGVYRLSGIQLVAGPSESSTGQSGQLAVLATCQYGIVGQGGGGFFSIDETTPFYYNSLDPVPTFTAKPGAPNRWEITLPEQIVAYLLKRFRSGSAAEAEPDD